jgi:protein-S-isoprenylcysteine O-methyltransferase Ste14
VTELASEVLGDSVTRWIFPWTLVILVGLAFVAWLMYVTRHRRRRWVLHRREEQALLRDFRSRRRHDETTSDHR